MLHIRSGGEHLLATGFGWGDVTLTERLPGGCWEAAWAMNTPIGWRHRLLEPGRLVEVYDGPLRVFKGLLAQPDWSAGAFSATGLWRDAANYPALDGGGNTTTVPDTAIDAQITAGWRATRAVSYSTTGLTASSTTPAVMMLDELLTLYATVWAQYPVVNADGLVSMVAPDASPSWLMVPKSVTLGTSMDDYASRVLVRYVDSASHAYTTVTASDAAAAARFGTRTKMADATNVGLGELTGTVAVNLAAGILANGKARPGFTDQIEATPWTLLTLGGQPGDLALVKYGQKVRLMGLFDNTRDLNGNTWMDVTVAETVKTWTGDRVSGLTISPLGSVASTFDQIVEDQYAATAKALNLVNY